MEKRQPLGILQEGHDLASTLKARLAELEAVLHRPSQPDESAALDRELEGARRERERVEMELAADSFLTSLTHEADPKAAERQARGPSDGASDCSVDEATFSSFDSKGLAAGGQAFDAIGATVTDDEFNELFGPTE